MSAGTELLNTALARLREPGSLVAFGHLPTKYPVTSALDSSKELASMTSAAANATDSSLLKMAARDLWLQTDVRSRCRSVLSVEERIRMEQFAFENATSAESYDIVISNGSFLETPCRKGLISVLPHGRCWHVSGSLLAPDELKPDMVRWLKDVSETNRKTIVAYSIEHEEASLFADAGFEVSKFGEEPLLDLGAITWQGKEFEWVRRQTSFCLRAGLEVVEIRDEAERHALADELLEIMHEDLKPRTYSQPLRLLEGQFDPYRLYRRRLFLARSRTTGRIEGFLACSPMRNGLAWAFETYRKRSSSPRGTIPFLFRDVIDRLQAEGVTTISLCLIPGRGMEEKTAHRSHWMARLAISLWYTHFNSLFNTRGQDHFKSRFRPRYVNRYICVTPKTSIRSISSFLVTTGAIRPNVRNLLRNLWK